RRKSTSTCDGPASIGSGRVDLIMAERSTRVSLPVRGRPVTFSNAMSECREASSILPSMGPVQYPRSASFCSAPRISSRLSGVSLRGGVLRDATGFDFDSGCLLTVRFRPEACALDFLGAAIVESIDSRNTHRDSASNDSILNDHD